MHTKYSKPGIGIQSFESCRLCFYYIMLLMIAQNDKTKTNKKLLPSWKFHYNCNHMIPQIFTIHSLHCILKSISCHFFVTTVSTIQLRFSQQTSPVSPHYSKHVSLSATFHHVCYASFLYSILLNKKYMMMAKGIFYSIVDSFL